MKIISNIYRWNYRRIIIILILITTGCPNDKEVIPEVSAEDLIPTLTNFLHVVLFSAAIPGQGGVGHINEQWPEYWCTLLEKYDFVVIDNIRWNFWDDPNILEWYKQNAFLFINKKKLSAYPQLKKELLKTKYPPYPAIHPQTWKRQNSVIENLQRRLVLRTTDIPLHLSIRLTCKSFLNAFKKRRESKPLRRVHENIVVP